MSMSHRIIALAAVPIPALGESELSSSIFSIWIRFRFQISTEYKFTCVRVGS